MRVLRKSQAQVLLMRKVCLSPLRFPRASSWLLFRTRVLNTREVVEHTRVYPHSRYTHMFVVCQGKRLLEQHPFSPSRTPLLEVEQGCEPALFLALFSYMLPPLAAVVLQGRDETPDLRQACLLVLFG